MLIRKTYFHHRIEKLLRERLWNNLLSSHSRNCATICNEALFKKNETFSYPRASNRCQEKGVNDVSNQLEEKYVSMIKKNKEEFYRLAYSHVKNEHDALDIVSEATYKGLQSLHRLREESYMKTWFYRILINESIAVLRSKKKIVYDTQYIEAIKEGTTSREDIMDLYRAIDRLPEKYKSIIMLKYLRQMQIKQIADIVELNESTVKTRLRRGIKKLKELMGGYTYGR